MLREMYGYVVTFNKDGTIDDEIISSIIWEFFSALGGLLKTIVIRAFAIGVVMYLLKSNPLDKVMADIFMASLVVTSAFVYIKNDHDNFTHFLFKGCGELMVVALVANAVGPDKIIPYLVVLVLMLWGQISFLVRTALVVSYLGLIQDTGWSEELELKFPVFNGIFAPEINDKEEFSE